MTRPRSEARTAKVVQLFDLRMRGASMRAASEAAGIPPASASQMYRCRHEDEIRADLARQLEGIVNRFDAQLRIESGRPL